MHDCRFYYHTYTQGLDFDKENSGYRIMPWV